MNIFDFFKKLPLWVYGLECQICEMTFISPQAHFDYVQKYKSLSKHEGKIPVLKK